MKAISRFLVASIFAGAALTGAYAFLTSRPQGTGSATGAEASPEGAWTVEERTAVSKASRELGPAFRPAEDDDAQELAERSALAVLYVEYHPFFVRGDLDGDGHLDFAQAFRQMPGGLFDVAVFFGREGGGFGNPVFAARDLALAKGDLSIERSLLVVTPDLTIEDVKRLRWDVRVSAFIDADLDAAGEGDDGIPIDPSGRPRNRV